MDEKNIPAEQADEPKAQESTPTSQQSSEEIIRDLKNQLEGIKKRQSDGDKLKNEALEKLKKVESQYSELQNQLKEKGIELDKLESLGNIKELEEKSKLSDVVYNTVSKVGLDSKQIQLLMKMNLNGKSEEEVEAEAKELKEMFVTPAEQFKKPAKVEKKETVLSGSDFFKAGHKK